MYTKYWKLYRQAYITPNKQYRKNILKVCFCNSFSHSECVSGGYTVVAASETVGRMTTAQLQCSLFPETPETYSFSSFLEAVSGIIDFMHSQWFSSLAH